MSVFEDKLRAQPVQFDHPRYDRPLTASTEHVRLTRQERDALADAVEALRKIPDVLERAHDGASGAWAGGAVDEAQDLATDALARLDAA